MVKNLCLASSTCKSSSKNSTPTPSAITLISWSLYPLRSIWDSTFIAISCVLLLAIDTLGSIVTCSGKNSGSLRVSKMKFFMVSMDVSMNYFDSGVLFQGLSIDDSAFAQAYSKYAKVSVCGVCSLSISSESIPAYYTVLISTEKISLMSICSSSLRLISKII